MVKAGGTRVEHRKQYIQGSDGRWQVAYTKVPRPELESASIFDAFPSPYATNQDDLDEFFYRHRMTRSQFRDLGSNPGFDSDTINEIIADRPNGTTVEDELEDARRKAAGQDATAARDRRYQVLEFWGSLSGKDLVDHGVGRCEEEYEALDESERSEILERAKERGEKLILLDKNSDYAANVWICAGRVLMARLSPVPDGRIPYKLVPYETVPHQILGTGIPAMMRDSQSTMNAAVRIFLDNLAISSGPMLEVNEELLASGEDPTDIYPWRVFLRDGGDPGAQAVRFYQPQTNNSGLSSVIEIFRRFADETTSLPSYTHGQQTDSLNETATGASMLMTAANVALKSTVRNIDDFLLEPVVHEMYDWNMEWSTKEWIKGDFRCRARGSTALVQKELQSQRLIQFFNIIATSPELAARSDIDQLLRDLAKSMDLDPDRLLPEERLNVQAQPGGVPGGPAPPEQVPGGVATPVGAPS